MYVPDSDWTAWDKNGAKMNSFMSSFDLADATKLTYKGRIFAPKVEKDQMRKKIELMDLGHDKNKLLNSGSECTLLKDDSVLISGGGEPSTRLEILNKSGGMRKLHNLSIPRAEHSVVQMNDGRIIVIGGRTDKEFADPETDEYTSTVEEVDLAHDTCRVIGRICAPRASVIAEPLTGNDIFLVGGWHKNSIGDYRWYRGAEIFKVPALQFVDDHRSPVR
jgi:hypothetical protein